MTGRLNIAAAAATLSLSLLLSAAAARAELREIRHTLPDDNLAVTVASAAPVETGGEDLSIWVGEVDLGGRSALWVELIDAEGEVIYNAEIGRNETHLLPDGRAIMVTALDADTPVAKADQSRVPSEASSLVTRRVVDAKGDRTAVEFIEETPRDTQPKLIEVARVGEAIWATIVSLFTGAAETVRVAWSWLVETLQA
ncbi:hypothetical protein [Pannonibacter tanglangensis]|uniref:hypothetical protein n=1 Tax=Pannonibacter tanglangensis TaxID=2750084 RepID=UPI001AD8E0DD|nr:hypothetical protein [Pannonibacter sp. XCT-34]